MASERHLRCAELVAAGAKPYDAMVGAGWPHSTAVWLSLDLDAFLAKAGVGVPVVEETDTAPSERAESGTLSDDPISEDEPAALDEPAVEDIEPPSAEEDVAGDPPSADASGEPAETQDDPAGTAPAPRRNVPAGQRRNKRVAK